MKNKGRFEVLKKIDKYVIVYIEKGEELNLSELDSKYSFDSYDEASEYVKNNKAELDKFVFDYKEKIRLEEEKRIAEEKARIEEMIRKNEEKAKNKAEKKEKRRDFWYSAKGVVASVTATAILLTGGHFIAAGISKKSDKDKKTTTSQTTSQEETVKTNETTQETVKYSYNYDENVVIVNDEKYEELTTEKFENLTALKIKELSDKGITLNSEDVIKYMMIANCDKLAQDNKNLISEIIGEQTTDEVQQDANKFLGAVVMYNYNVWYSEGSTKNFIKVSDTIFDEEERNKVIEIEKRVDEIALASNDTVKFNNLVNDLLKDMLDPTNELSYLESGVAYALQIVLEPVRGLYGDGLDMENNPKLNKTNLGLIMEFVPYSGDEEYRKQHNMEEKSNDDTFLSGYVRNISDILNECPRNSKKLTN